MGLDYNAYAQILLASNLTQDEVYTAAFETQKIVAKVLGSGAIQLPDDQREALEGHLDTLRRTLTPMFHPVGINSDPFVPRYCASQLQYYRDERGLVIVMADKDGVGVMIPEYHLVNDNPAIDDAYVERTLRAKATEWELPYREPYVASLAALEDRLNEKTAASFKP